MSSGWATWALAGLAICAVGAGLAVTGGPMQGRREARDAVRQRDLMAIWAQAQCRVRAGEALDGDVSANAVCPDAPRLSDPYTEQPYLIEVVDSNSLRLCAGFEVASEKRRQGWSNPADLHDSDGCLLRHLAPNPGGQLPRIIPEGD